MIAELLARLSKKDRHALARLLTIAARGGHLADIAAGMSTNKKSSLVVAFTGGGGVGKSSLIGKLIDLARADAKTVGVLACDPQSPITGGALLGDRTRMGSRTDDGVFIRSLATCSGSGAVAEHLDLLIRLAETFGFDMIFVETVGAGQGDTAVHALADAVVLLLQPESGDDLQWEKAGVLEIADIVVVHKADLPGAEKTAAQVRAALALSGRSHAHVVTVSSKTGQGLAELWQSVKSSSRRRTASS